MWKDLSMQEKAILMKLGIENGIYSLEELRNTYDSEEANYFAEGGYTVKKGDSLWRIAHNNGVSMNDLLKYNSSLKGDINTIIHPGDVIYTGPKNNVEQTEQRQNIRIKRGDSLSSIAKREGISMKDIMASNPTIKDPNLIMEGQELTIRRAKPTQVITNTPKEQIVESAAPKKVSDFKTIDAYYSKPIEKKQEVVETPKQVSESKIPMGETYYDEYIQHDKFNFAPVKVPEEAIKKSGLKYHVDPIKCSRTDTKECATYLTQYSVSPDGKSFNSDYINKYNYRGSAWTWFQNAEKKGFKPTMNIYTDGNFFTGEEDKPEVIKKTREIASTKGYKDKIRQSVKPGSVVTLLYPRSSHFEDAKKESKGTMLSTHIGDVISRNGKLFVRDNTGGHIHERPLEDVINNKQRDGVLITGIMNYPLEEGHEYSDMSKLGYSYSSELNRKDRVSSSGIYRIAQALQNNKEALIEDGISEEEFEEYMQIIPALALQESNGGTGLNYLKDAKGTNIKEKIDSINYKLMKKGINPTLKGFESKGMTNIKYLGDRGDGKPLFTQEELEKYGITEDVYTNPEMIETPEVSGVMTAVALHKKANEIRDILKNTPPSIKNDKELFNALLIQSWNQGTKNIKKNVEKYMKNHDRNELEQYKGFSYISSIKQKMNYMPYKGTEDVLNKVSKGLLDVDKMNKEQIKQLQKELYKSNLLQDRISINGKLNDNTKKALERMKAAKENNMDAEDAAYYDNKARLAKMNEERLEKLFGPRHDWMNTQILEQ